MPHSAMTWCRRRRLLLLHLLALGELRHHRQEGLPQRVAAGDHAELELQLLLSKLLAGVARKHLIQRRVLLVPDERLDGLTREGEAQ